MNSVFWPKNALLECSAGPKTSRIIYDILKSPYKLHQVNPYLYGEKADPSNVGW